MKKKLALAGAVAALACLAGPASPAVAAGCPSSYPYHVTSARFQGFLLVCSSAGQRYLRIENISAIVYDVQPGRTSRVQVDGPSTRTLLGLATRRSAPPSCPGGRYCVLAPGGFAFVGGRPAQAYISRDLARTRVTLAARLVAGQIESRLRPRAASRIGSVLSCARNVASTLQSAGWVALRSSLNVAASCPSLMRELYATRDGRLALDSRVTRVGTRLLNQEGFLDVLLSGLKTLVRTT